MEKPPPPWATHASVSPPSFLIRKGWTTLMPPRLMAGGRTPGVSWRPPHLTFPERCELESGQVPPELGIAGRLLELPIGLGGVKLGWEGLRRKKGLAFGPLVGRILWIVESPRGAGGRGGSACGEGYNELSSEFHGLRDGLCRFPDGDFVFLSHCGGGKDHGCSLMERGFLGGSQGLPDKIIGSTSSYSRRTQRKSRARSCGRADNSWRGH